MDSYPTGNKSLIATLNLAPHPEGGYFAETDRQDETIPSPFTQGQPRSLATSIYYLLTPERSSGFFHMNKSITYHVLHQGRAEYTLIHPPPTHPLTPPLSRDEFDSEPNHLQKPGPRIETVIMGTNADAGEVRMLLVGTGVWKKSTLLPEDLKRVDESPESSDTTGCLITEVVVPGFAWEDHKYLTKSGLEELFSSTEGGDAYLEKFMHFVKADMPVA